MSIRILVLTHNNIPNVMVQLIPYNKNALVYSFKITIREQNLGAFALPALLRTDRLASGRRQTLLDDDIRAAGRTSLAIVTFTRR